MLNRQRSNVSKSTEVIDLNVDTKIHYPGLNDFYFAFGITDDYGNIYDLNSSIFSINMYRTIIDRTGINVTAHSTPIPYRKCKEEDFSVSNREASDVLLNDTFYWPEDKNYTIRGNYGADVVHYIQFGLTKCIAANSSDTSCISDIDNEIQKYRIGIAIANSYVDFNDYDTPVKRYLDDRYTYSLTPGTRKIIRSFIRPNTAEFKDSLLDIGFSENKEFYSIERVDSDFTIEPATGTLFDYIMLLDPNQDNYERNVYTLFDLSGQI